MGLPDQKTLDEIRAQLSHVEGTEDATPLETLRFKICQTLLKKAQEENLTNREMASICEINESDISKIFHYRIEKFSTDKLMKILLKAVPDHSVVLRAG